jgi:DNA repair protein RadC
MSKDREAKSHEGHRERLRQRFLKGGRRAFPDYEFLELLLTYVIPRRDTKPIAKELLRKHRSFNSVLSQTKDRLEAVKGMGKEASTFILVIRACIERYLEQKVEKRKSISSPLEVMQFARAQLSGKQRECLLALYLSDSKRLLHHAIISEGTVNRTAFYPREIIRQGLVYNATGVIMVHNHPEGEPVPSDQDLQMTRKLEQIAEPLGIDILDHIIVTPLQAYSIKTGKLL